MLALVEYIVCGEKIRLQKECSWVGMTSVLECLLGKEASAVFLFVQCSVRVFGVTAFVASRKHPELNTTDQYESRRYGGTPCEEEEILH